MKKYLKIKPFLKRLNKIQNHHNKQTKPKKFNKIIQQNKDTKHGLKKQKSFVFHTTIQLKTGKVGHTKKKITKNTITLTIT